MAKYYLRLKTLSPLHIGSGFDFEPTSYIIDNKKLFEFDEVEFYHSLKPIDKERFNKINNLSALKKFYRDKKELAKELSFREIRVSSKIAKIYEKEFNKDGTQNRNQLHIAKTVTIPSCHLAYIPGSSIKGVIETALDIYKSKGNRATNEERQNLLVSDFLPVKLSTSCGKAMRKHKYRDIDGKGIPAMIEAIDEGSSFVGVIESRKRGLSDKVYTLEEIIASLEEFDKKADSKMYERYRAKALKSKSVFRMGRFVGQNFTAIDLENKPKTHSLFTIDGHNFIPFGWVAIEQISKDDYNQELEIYNKTMNQNIEILSKKRQIVKERELASKIEQEKRRKKEEERKREKELEELKQKEQAQREKERLAKMSPVDRLLEEYKDKIPELINKMMSQDIENFEEIKLELAKKIKIELQKNPKTWDRAKQKALKRKEFIQKILGEL